MSGKQTRGATFDTTVDSDGMWHTVCREMSDAFGTGATAQEAYEAARFALDTLCMESDDARPTVDRQAPDAASSALCHPDCRGCGRPIPRSNWNVCEDCASPPDDASYQS